MTNWPNIQEYRNFEAKLIDDPKRQVLTDSIEDSDLETVIKDDYKAKNNTDGFLNNQKFQNPECKIIRCVIKKDFEETFKKIDREGGVILHHDSSTRLKPQDPAANRSPDRVRLQNHMKWKKQKEEEYLQKKESEKIAQQKKREEELRLEKVRKLKEKEKEEKLREWQEQKAREKEEKKKEKMVIKKLEEDLKVTPSVDKEKLIEEWVKLKDKQKQIEAEKKAELLRKQEESKALRQNLAKLSYRQWKEKLKGRITTLPKNGYQIFGPKPVPVVKEDWNHDFINSTPRDRECSLRNTKSSTNTTATFTFCPSVKELGDFSKDLFYLEDVKNKSPSCYQLKATKSGLNINESSRALSEAQYEMPLKELQPGTIGLKKKGTRNLKNEFEYKKEGFVPHDLDTKSEINFFSNQNGRHKPPENYPVDFTCFPSAQENQNRCLAFPFNKNLSECSTTLPIPQLLPNKKKIDLYINTCSDNSDDFPAKAQKKQTIKNSEGKINGEAKKTTEKKNSNQTVKNSFREKTVPQNRIRSLSLHKIEKNTNERVKTKRDTPFEPGSSKFKACRSQSCEKPVKKITKSEPKMKGCLSSKSMVKMKETAEEMRRSHVRVPKSKIYCGQKTKGRKSDSFEITASKSEKKLLEFDCKTKKKYKRKNVLAKSFSFSDSPYCAKTTSKSLIKFKGNRRKNMKDVETKSEQGGRSRKLSKTKI